MGAPTLPATPTILLNMPQNDAQNDAVDHAVENADVWALARNPVYRNIQQKLIERTAERDVLRYVHNASVTVVCIHTRGLH